jgi:putative colanic acid biosynthesis UDP-glucose lipid carrier transferase
MKSNRESLAVAFAPLLDGLFIALSGWVAYFLRWESWSMPTDYLTTLIVATALAVLLLPVSGAYQSWRGNLHWHNLGHAIPGLFAVVVALSLIGTLMKTTAEYSRLWMGYWAVLSLLALFLFRRLVGWIQSAQSVARFGPRRILIVGQGEFARSVAEKLLSYSGTKVEVVGFIAVGDSSEDAVELPAPLLGSHRELPKILASRNENLDEIWLAVADLSVGSREIIMEILQRSSLVVRFVPDLSMLALLNHMPAEVAGMTVIDLNASPLSGYNTALKSAFDKIFAVTALIIMSPLLCFIVLAIKLDSRGPALFRQQRHGWDGSIIQILKFRTMKHVQDGENPYQQAVKHDPRITRVGSILRRTSLDELPQFFNVLRGEMSVVGPRPHPLELNESFNQQIEAYMQRHRVKPGITGWAQVHGLRGETETLEKMQKRVEYDLYYIENWSMWLDIKIIIRTILGGWTNESAY